MLSHISLKVVNIFVFFADDQNSKLLFSC